MLEICLESKKLSYHLSVYGKFCVITGLSGIGKSIFFKLLDEYTRGDKTIKFSCNIDGNTVDSLDITAVADSIPFLKKKGVEIVKDDRYVYFVDDDDFEQHDIVMQLISVTTNSYYVLVTRNEVIKGINYGIDDIYTYELSADGRMHKLVQYNKTKLANDVNILKYIDRTIILSEDSKAGLQFYKKLFKSTTVPVSDLNNNISGKDYIVTWLLNNYKKYNRVIVMLDWCSYGSNVTSYVVVKGLMESDNVELVQFTDIRSFEYLILCTNLLKNVMGVKSLKSIYVTLTISEERFYEEVLARLTNNEEFQLAHTGKELSTCYYLPCCHKDTGKRQCMFGIAGKDKMEALFKGTNFEYVLQFRRL